MSDQAVLLLRKQLKGARVVTVRPLTPFARVPAYKPFIVVGAPFLQNSLSFSRSTMVVVLAELSRNPIEGFSAGLVDDSNVFEWAVTIMGPPDTM